MIFKGQYPTALNCFWSKVTLVNYKVYLLERKLLSSFGYPALCFLLTPSLSFLKSQGLQRARDEGFWASKFTMGVLGIIR